MKIKSEIKIGFIVLATILLVIWGINYLKGKNVLKRTDVYYVVFQDISGLKQSGSVYIHGMKVGLINNISFNTEGFDRIEVAFGVNKDIKIPKNSTIELYSSDLMGNKALRIIPSDSKDLANLGDTLIGSVEMDLFAGIQAKLAPLTEKAADAIESLDSLMISFNEILDPETQKKLRSSISNLEETTGSLASQLSKDGKLNQTLINLEGFSKTLNENKTKLSSIFANMENITDSIAKSNLKSALLNMNKTFDQTQLLLSRINEGEGTLGLLTTNDSLYNNLKDASANLSILLNDLNENPKRYVHFSIFGKKDETK